MKGDRIALYRLTSASSRRFPLHALFDPPSHHCLILRFPLGFRQRLQGLNQFRRQSDSTWAAPSRVRHSFVKVCWVHPVILGLNFLPFTFR